MWARETRRHGKKKEATMTNEQADDQLSSGEAEHTVAELAFF